VKLKHSVGAGEHPQGKYVEEREREREREVYFYVNASAREEIPKWVKQIKKRESLFYLSLSLSL
jgi:uncharacterized protein (DUF58 family)